MKKFLFMAVASIMAIGAFSQETVKKIRVYERNNVVFERNYDFVDSVVFVDEVVYDTQEGMLPGAFTMNAEGKQVHFSKGNLQAIYDGISWTWAFAEHQWDCIGGRSEGGSELQTGNNFITGNGIVSANGVVDLFGWSTATTYYGIHNSIDNNNYSGDFVDWGVNQISNGGNIANKWWTLTPSEWVFLVYDRPNAENLRGIGTVNGVHGYILLPDGANPEDWGFVGNFDFYTTGWDWNSNIYSGDSWTEMENAGAVFLPCPGNRYGTDVNAHGYAYWGAESGSSWMHPDRANGFDFQGGSAGADINRCLGLAVRLVR